MKLITPTKGIRRKNLNNDMMVTPDEGDELFDSEGDELISWKQVQEKESDEEENSETEGQDSTVPIIKCYRSGRSIIIFICSNITCKFMP